MNKILKYIFFSIIIVIIVLGIIFASKVIIFKNLSKKLDEYASSTNYYIREYYYEGWYSSKTEYWFKDNQLVAKYNDELDYVYSKTEEGNQVDDGLDIDVAIRHIKSISEKLNNPINIFKYSLTSSERNGKKCYKLENKNSIIYIDKETGLIVRVENIRGFETPSENEVQSTILDYSYEFNNVTDEVMTNMMNENKN